jgi:hypothetical protein
VRHIFTHVTAGARITGLGGGHAQRRVYLEYDDEIARFRIRSGAKYLCAAARLPWEEGAVVEGGLQGGLEGQGGQRGQGVEMREDKAAALLWRVEVRNL